MSHRDRRPARNRSRFSQLDRLELQPMPEQKQRQGGHEVHDDTNSRALRAIFGFDIVADEAFHRRRKEEVVQQDKASNSGQQVE